LLVKEDFYIFFIFEGLVKNESYENLYTKICYKKKHEKLEVELICYIESSAKTGKDPANINLAR
jgi:hypothetical protein